MKPSVCEVCGARAWEAPSDRAGGLVQFANWRPLKPGEIPIIGHPEGLEFFCEDHLQMAQALRHLPSDEAILRLRQETGMCPPIPVPPDLPQNQFMRLLGKFFDDKKNKKTH